MSSRSAVLHAAPVSTIATLALKKLLFPGMNLHARERYRYIPDKFGTEIAPGSTVLDAGCGNGMLSYQAWKRGARVQGISIKQKEVDGCRSMFNEGRRIPDKELRFDNVNLLDLARIGRQFDAIICTEVLEHIRDDRSVCLTFFELLKPGGCLYITTPNAEHWYNKYSPLDVDARGGHVRAGYTFDSYRALFEPAGFTLEEMSGLGGPIRQTFNKWITEMQERFGVAAGLPLFLLALPLLWMDSRSPRVPMCLFARARKPANAPTSQNTQTVEQARCR